MNVGTLSLRGREGTPGRGKTRSNKSEAATGMAARRFELEVRILSCALR